MAAISKMSYWFHPDAENEFNQVINYYEKIKTGLGYNFAIERKQNAIFTNDRNLSSLIFCFFGFNLRFPVVLPRGCSFSGFRIT